MNWSDTMKLGHRRIGLLVGVAAGLLLSTACVSSDPARGKSGGAESRSRASRSSRHADLPVRQVVCIYEQRPWLNLDASGDRDPEGLRYRAFLDAGATRGELRNGMFHVELYVVERDATGAIARRLVSDWHFPTEEVNTVNSGLLGRGYHIQLRWATKAVAGKEIEIITVFEDSEGRKTRSGTKRLRVPRYTS